MSRQQNSIEAEKDLISLIMDGEYKKAKDAVFPRFISSQFNFDEFVYPLDQIRPELNGYSGATALEVAATDGEWDFVLWMVSIVLPDVQKHSELTLEQIQQFQELKSRLLLRAVMANKPDIVSKLLAEGADPNLLRVVGGKYDDTTVLDWAIMNGSFDIVKMLVAAGADPVKHGQSVKKFTCLKSAVKKAQLDGEEYWHLIPILASKPAEDAETVRAYSEALCFAAMFGQTEIVIHLLSVGADPNLLFARSGSEKIRGWTALHFAFHRNDPTMALYLMAAGADPDLAGEDNVPTFRQLVEGKNGLVNACLDTDNEEARIRCVFLALDFFPELPIRKPRLPGPTGIMVVLLAAKELLVSLTLKVCLVFNIISQKKFEALTPPKKDLVKKPRISPAADRFFEARTRAIKKRHEAEKTTVETIQSTSVELTSR